MKIERRLALGFYLYIRPWRQVGWSRKPNSSIGIKHWQMEIEIGLPFCWITITRTHEEDEGLW